MMKYMKSQSAMEYLMTYGWAILIIAVVLGVLFQLGVFGGANLAPKAQPGSCQVEHTSVSTSLEGMCQGELPQYVAVFSPSPCCQATVPTSTSINTSWNGGNWSITAWFDATQQLGTGVGRDLVEEDEGCTSGLWIDTPSSPATYYEVAGCAWWQPTGDTSSCQSGTIGSCEASTLQLPYNKWVFLAVTFNFSASTNGANQLVCYNAQCQTFESSVPSGDAPTNYVKDDLVDRNLVFRLFDNGCCSTNTISGDLANIQLYNASLSQTEITGLYQEGIGGAPVRPQNLVGWWPMNSNLNDYSGNNNNGQPSTGITYTGFWTSAYTAP